MRPTFVRTPAAMRAWLAAHGATRRELHVGFYKTGSGKKGITYAQALDEALCFGWIDGVRRSLDEERWTIRFTPRKPRSYWSLVNIRHAERLIKQGRMAPMGLRAFEGRDAKAAARYSFERKAATLAPADARTFRANARAWSWFREAAPSYQRAATHWVVSAKQDATRARRLAALIASSARGERVAPLRPRMATRGTM